MLENMFGTEERELLAGRGQSSSSSSKESLNFTPAATASNIQSVYSVSNMTTDDSDTKPLMTFHS
jgi:hypothetical protein